MNCPPRSASSMAAKTLGESRLGRHSQSIDPSKQPARPCGRRRSPRNPGAVDNVRPSVSASRRPAAAGSGGLDPPPLRQACPHLVEGHSEVPRVAARAHPSLWTVHSSRRRRPNCDEQMPGACLTTGAHADPCFSRSHERVRCVGRKTYAVPGSNRTTSEPHSTPGRVPAVVVADPRPALDARPRSQRTVTSRMIAAAPASSPRSSRRSAMESSSEIRLPSFRSAGTASNSCP